ncbi:exodeoxyribonuclease V subunit beta [Aminivibrio sp.]|uniref:UvrD-helicase domain-containing protein n=1 Tax=Aminivibrio sp. TaxID=1872489 RepID=UPI001A4F597F|nr:UvrD-helicase domain-containing protein [Aminivibrio sp.]MBL3539824.1 UvrD-helicase domain-containing protein [Aminivibrio sp.]
MTDGDILTERLRDSIAAKGSLLPAQEEAVFSDAPLTLVGAGAGTGKTHTLSWRFLRALLREGMRPRDILTLTFTEKAAREMADRIAARFNDMRPLLDPDGTLLARAAGELSEAPVSTIHSFALNILREEALFLSSGLSARPISPPEERQFTGRATAALDALDLQWFRNALPGGRTPEEFLGESLEDLPPLLNAYTPDTTAGFAFSLANILESRGMDPDGLLASAGDREYFAPVIERLKAVCLPQARETAEIWLGRVLPGLPAELPGGGAYKEKLAAFRNSWRGASPEALDAEGTLAFASELYGRLLKNLSGATGNAAKKAAELAGCLSLKEHRDRFAFLWKGLGFLDVGEEPLHFRLRNSLLSLTALLWCCCREFRRRRGLLSFDDMIRLAAEAAAAGQGGRRIRTYREILVDEFQDTNPLQDALIRSVAGEECRMFLVGDLKQSVYRFRHADPTLFGSLILRRGGGDRYIPLQASFRTRSSLLERINGIFAHVWRNGLSSSLPQEYEALVFPGDPEQAKLRENTPLPPLDTVIRYARPLENGEGKKTESTGEVRVRVARGLAAKLAGFRGMDVWDKKDGRRPARWKDMAVLVPARTSFPALEKVFRSEAAIPVAFEKGKEYFNRGEIGDLAAAIRTIAFPEDRGALSAFLCTPFSGLSLEEAYALLPAGEDFPVRHPEAANRLEALRAEARYSGLFSALCSLLRDQSYLRAYPAWNRRNVLANLRQALDMVREYEAVFGPDPAGCDGYFASLRSGQGTVTETSPPGDEEDVVRVMTVHSAKGLEFPIVAVVDLNKAPGGRGGKGEPLVASPLLGAGASSYPREWTDSGEECESATGKLASFLEKTEVEEEWQRLFYVACTRAMDCLVLCSPCGLDKDGSPSPQEGSWLSMLGEEFLPGPCAAEDDPRKIRRKTEDTSGEIPSVRWIPSPSAADLRYERLSATSYALFSWCPAAWRMKFRQGLELAWELPSSEEFGGADLGSLAHWVLARWNFTVPGLDRFLGPTIPSRLPPRLRAAWNDEGGRAALREWLTITAEGAAGRKLAALAADGGLQREIPFRVPLRDGPLLTGAMDVLWREGDRLFIRDYKITAGDESLNAREEPSWKFLYDSQLLFYACAARAVFGEAETDIRLIRLRTGEEGEPVVPEGSWQTVEEDIRSTALTAAQGPFPPRTDRCRRCFYRLDCPFRG